MLPPRRAARLAVRPFALILALVATACGGGDGRSATSRDSSAAPTAPAVASPVPTASPAVDHSAPRWETVTTFTGSGPTETPEFAIVPNAIQWRVRWSCETGTLRITTTPPPRRPAPLAESACPASGHGFAIHTGAVRLGVETGGGWSAVVDQQVDTPLDEPPPADAASATVVAEGRFHDVEKPGTGSVRLYRLGDGHRVVRFEGFQTAENTDLFVWLSEARDPRTSVDALGAKRVVLGNLKSTLGNQNYDVPPHLSDDRIRSVVIWCEPIAIAYTAASLER
jgi:hypothetical protein